MKVTSGLRNGRNPSPQLRTEPEPEEGGTEGENARKRRAPAGPPARGGPAAARGRAGGGAGLGPLGAGRAATRSLLLPVTDDDVRVALRRLAIWPLLAGVRGRLGADLDAVVAAIQRIAFAATATDERFGLVELEVNPLLAAPDGATVVDALITRAPLGPDVQIRPPEENRP